MAMEKMAYSSAAAYSADQPTRKKNGVVIMYTSEMSDSDGRRKRIDDLISGPASRPTVPVVSGLTANSGSDKEVSQNEKNIKNKIAL
jgi:hypothetical protein